MVLNQLRANGYWIIGGSSVVGYHITNCVVSQKCQNNVKSKGWQTGAQIGWKEPPGSTFHLLWRRLFRA